MRIPEASEKLEHTCSEPALMPNGKKACVVLIIHENFPASHGQLEPAGRSYIES